MASKAGRKTIASADGGRSGPVTLVEALERLSSRYDGNPHKVANWLNERHKEGDIRLLGNDVAMAPGSNPSMLGIVAHIPQVGSAVLYVQVRHGRIDSPDGCAYWQPDRSMELLEQHRQFWTFDRESFEKHFPGPAKDPGGHPTEFSKEDLFAEALVYVGASLPRTMTGEGSLHEKLKLRIGPRCPEESQFKEFFGPIYRRIKDESRR